MGYADMAKTAGGGGGGSYIKWKDLDSGPKKLSFFGPQVTGFECWVENGEKRSPVRCATLAELLEQRPATGWARQERDGEKSEDQPKFFVARMAFDHSDKKFKVVQITQKSILKRLDAIEANEDWGPDFTAYDVTFTRKKGDNGFFEYGADAAPRKKFDAATLKEWERIESECLGLAALFNNGDPFAPFSDNAPPF